MSRSTGCAASEARALELERRVEGSVGEHPPAAGRAARQLNRSTELEGDLRAAEDAINRLETELRAKSASWKSCHKTNEEWRSTIESARQSLAERESLIHRLETEAANSAVLLGNIQQSIKRLDPSQQRRRTELRPEGAVRLLIRTDGDSKSCTCSAARPLGRTPDNDLQIDAKFISRHHAVILAGPTHTIIEDLNSTNGVLVNSRRITRHTLRDGDKVRSARPRSASPCARRRATLSALERVAPWACSLFDRRGPVRHFVVAHDRRGTRRASS